MFRKVLRRGKSSDARSDLWSIKSSIFGQNILTSGVHKLQGTFFKYKVDFTK